MTWANGFIAVDWGTTNRRAYLLAPDGRCAGEFEDELGVLSVEPGGFPGAAAAIRERLGDLPLLMAGMVGSSRGWIEAPYTPCPAGLDDLVSRLVWAERGRSAIVPGLCLQESARWDVMRGEELQLFGAVAAGLVGPRAYVAHPGTHNKWIAVDGGRIVRFRTVMTGELFSLLKSHGVLAEFLGSDVAPDGSFRAGVRRGLERPVTTAELFSVRARVLLGDLERDAVPAYVSGMLIGLDLSVGLADEQGAEVTIMGRPELTALYAAAAQEAGAACSIVDGADAFVAGARALAERIA